MRHAFAVLLSVVSLAQARERSPAHYENWGVCPFECCTYRAWTAEDEVTAYASRSEKSAVLFRLRPHETVEALTGVVVTDKPGTIRIDHPVQDGYLGDQAQPALNLHAGETIYLLSPLGEGDYLFWYRGKVYRSGAALSAMPQQAPAQMRWWKLVLNKDGKQGWVISDRFSNADACG
jgi:hypothetical protein